MIFIKPASEYLQRRQSRRILGHENTQQQQRLPKNMKKPCAGAGQRIPIDDDFSHDEKTGD